MPSARKKAEEVIEELNKNPDDAEAAAKKSEQWEKLEPCRGPLFYPQIG
jgi:hypothetical protein